MHVGLYHLAILTQFFAIFYLYCIFVIFYFVLCNCRFIISAVTRLFSYSARLITLHCGNIHICRVDKTNACPRYALLQLTHQHNIVNRGHAHARNMRTQLIKTQP